MAWIKVLTTLPTCRAVYQLMRELRCKRHAALGLAVDWLCWLDANSSDGHTGMLDEEISDVLGWPRAAQALNAIGWVSHDEQGCVVALEFDKHCGESAKKRAEDAARKLRSRAQRDACHAHGVTNVTNFCDQSREEYIMKNKGVGRSAVCVGSGSAPAPPPDGFSGWLSALCEAHPSARQSRVLAPDVRAAALDAFARCPQAAGQAGLLRAYFEDRLQEDRYRKPFYRPTGQRKFFHDLEDVLAHAERWARESGWARKHRPKARGGKGVAAPCSDGLAASDAEREAFFKELRG